jgi:uncharacterized protein with von Willebrand factor type A (vWA) domain
VEEVEIVIVLDGSGSMMGCIPSIMADVRALLKQAPFTNAAATLMQFSGGYQIWKMIVGKNKAAMVNEIDTPVKGIKWTHTADQAIGSTYGGGTDFSGTIVAQLEKALAKNCTVLLVSDTDLCSGQNAEHLKGLIKRFPRGMFVIWNNRDSYITWRKSNGASKTMSYFK